MKKAIVTGASGFIGRFLVRELLKQNVEVIAVIRENSKNLNILQNLPVKVVECNMIDYKTLSNKISAQNIDAVFHIAWQGISDADARSQQIQLQNLNTTLDLIEEAKKMNIGTFVGCGSMHEQEALIDIAEDKTISNLGYMYKAAKTAAHWMGKAKCGNYSIRFFWPLINTYGEEEISPRLLNNVIYKIFKNESPALSSGEQIYDFVHVQDVAHALYLIAEKGVDGTNYTIGSGNPRQLKTFMEIVGQTANRLNGNTNVPLSFGKIVNNVVFLPKEIFDITKLVKDTGFQPQISFEEGVERTAGWIKTSLF